MVLEIATITLKPGNADAFISVMPDAFPFVESTPGYIRHELHRGIENPDVFTLFIWWETLEEHTVSFRQSERFAAWRAVWGHLMEHSDMVHVTQVY
ncbi:antibiotic biosynthesis monooxygenase family protein [Deinococcus sp.]|uniref:antibiotic biosynthesis monooxygenase family protein n=1 Tax=Deinococcus sp. TaxID=47478 RepID=UPI003C7E8CA8